MPDEPTRPLQVSPPAPTEPPYYPLAEQPYEAPAPASKRPVTPVVAGILGAVLGLVVGVGGTLVIHQSASGTSSNGQVGGPGGGPGGTRPTGAPGNGFGNGNAPNRVQPSGVQPSATS